MTIAQNAYATFNAEMEKKYTSLYTNGRDWKDQATAEEKKTAHTLYSAVIEETYGKTIDTGNNESLRRGITQETDGTYTAVSFSASKNFKTIKGAEKWLARRSA